MRINHLLMLIILLVFSYDTQVYAMDIEEEDLFVWQQDDNDDDPFGYGNFNFDTATRTPIQFADSFNHNESDSIPIQQKTLSPKTLRKHTIDEFYRSIKQNIASQPTGPSMTCYDRYPSGGNSNSYNNYPSNNQLDPATLASLPQNDHRVVARHHYHYEQQALTPMPMYTNSASIPATPYVNSPTLHHQSSTYHSSDNTPTHHYSSPVSWHHDLDMITEEENIDQFNQQQQIPSQFAYTQIPITSHSNSPQLKQKAKFITQDNSPYHSPSSFYPFQMKREIPFTSYTLEFNEYISLKSIPRHKNYPYFFWYPEPRKNTVSSIDLKKYESVLKLIYAENIRLAKENNIPTELIDIHTRKVRAFISSKKSAVLYEEGQILVPSNIREEIRQSKTKSAPTAQYPRMITRSHSIHSNPTPLRKPNPHNKW